MKKYLILTFNVCNMGGGQLFVLRRARHLKNKGYDVHIVVTYHIDYFPLKEQFDGFHLYHIPELGHTSSMYTNKRVKEVIETLKDKIDADPSLLIESHTLPTAEWGELMASEYGARHLAYPLAEPKVSKYRFSPGVSIFYNKLNRGEFYGCSSTSLSEIFDTDRVPPHYVNIGYDEKELYDICEPRLNIRKGNNDYLITTVTRLDKIYVEPLIENTILLSEKYPQQNFILLIAGGSKTPGREEYLFSKFTDEKINRPNLRVIFSGYIEKLGKDIFQMTDVFVGMGTAVINSISQSCITINIDPRHYMRYASGFFGADTTNFAYSENGKIFPIVDKLEEAYLMNEEEKNNMSLLGRKLCEEAFEDEACMQKLDDIVLSIEVVSKEQIKLPSIIYKSVVICITRLYRGLSVLKNYKW